MNEYEEMVRDPLSRRAFLSRMTAAGFGMTALALLEGGLTGCTGDSNSNGIPDATNFPGIPGRSVDEAVLNFALTLEILEADLYRQALNLASGRALSTPLLPIAQSASYTRTVGGGGLSAGNTAAGFLYLQQFAYIEAAHRDFLRTAIQGNGGTPVSANPNGYRFASNVNPDIKSILLAILPLEETGVRAYLGAAPFINDLNLTTTAVGIYSTEARHSAAIHYILGQDAGPVPQAGDKKVTPTYPSPNTFEYYLDPPTVLTAVQPLLVP